MPGRRTLLLKISGEALKAAEGIHDPAIVAQVCTEIAAAVRGGKRIALVVGGGNIVRGARVAAGADPTAGDYMGMLATLINAIALREGLLAAGCRALVVGPHAIPNVCAGYVRSAVMAELDAGAVVIFGGGTGHPFLTTDTTAALRGAEIGADEVLKASNVDGVYDRDPRKDPAARRFDRLSFDQCLAGRYAVMDQTAFTLCRDRHLPIRVFAMDAPGAIASALGDDPPGTLIA
jgi:uridylate kinase